MNMYQSSLCGSWCPMSCVERQLRGGMPCRHEADAARKSLESSTEQIASLRRSIELRAGARPNIASFMAEAKDASEPNEETAMPDRYAVLGKHAHVLLSGCPVGSK